MCTAICMVCIRIPDHVHTHLIIIIINFLNSKLLYVYGRINTYVHLLEFFFKLSSMMIHFLGVVVFCNSTFEDCPKIILFRYS